MQKILIHLGMGGHTSQMLRLINILGPNYQYEYIVGKDDQTSIKKIKFSGKIHIIKNPRLMKDKSLLKVFFNMFPTTLRAFKILRSSRPKAIISAGPSQTIPLFWLAKLLRIKTIFIESWVRVHHKSQTGKLVYPVTDLFIVQWKTMKKVYPKAVYAGRLS
jgi:UDP-N-acetylglucosamine:LPS N-acetylglucosamine transferase